LAGHKHRDMFRADPEKPLVIERKSCRENSAGARVFRRRKGATRRQQILNDLVGALNECHRDRQSQRFRSRKAENEIKFC
jgi:hypothetical protein